MISSVRLTPATFPSGEGLTRKHQTIDDDRCSFSQHDPISAPSPMGKVDSTRRPDEVILVMRRYAAAMIITGCPCQIMSSLRNVHICDAGAFDLFCGRQERAGRHTTTMSTYRPPVCCLIAFVQTSEQILRHPYGLSMTPGG